MPEVVTGPAGVPPIIAARLRTVSRPHECQWFAGCIRPASGVVRHATLGEVPCCAECAARLDLPIRLTDPEAAK